MRAFSDVPFEWWIKRASGTLFDALHGVDTDSDSVERPSDAVGSNRHEAVPYDPAPWSTLRRALRLAALNARGFAFVDVGCGKGRVLLSASVLPFERIIGVEFSPSLCRIAERNLRNARFIHRRCTNIEIACTDAATYRVPDEPTIFFFYNPFGYEVMQAVLDNIITAHTHNPQARYLIFYAVSVHMPRITAFLRQRAGDWASLIATGTLGERSLNIVALADSMPEGARA